jgi:aldose 1-epimerase
MKNDSVLTIAAGPNSVTIDPEAGGRIASWTVDGLQLLVERDVHNHPFGWGSYPMVPFAGRIRRGHFEFAGASYDLPINMAPHAIHGTGYDVPWEVLTHTRNTVILGLRIGAPWPFSATATHIMQLQNDRLIQQMTITGGPTDQPVTFGWHPWFRRKLDRGQPLDLRVDMSQATMFERDGDGIATKDQVDVPNRPWDDCFRGAEAISLVWPGALALDVHHDCPVTVLYDPAHAVCVEPQSGPPDAVAVDPPSCFLPASGSMEHTVTWHWRCASRP